MDPDVATDLDTPEDLQRWTESRGAGAQVLVRVRLFALAKDIAGCSEVAVVLPQEGTVGDLRFALAQSVPALAPLLPKIVVAVDEEFALDDTPLSTDSRIALIPPVSGGAGGGDWR